MNPLSLIVLPMNIPSRTYQSADTSDAARYRVSSSQGDHSSRDLDVDPPAVVASATAVRIKHGAQGSEGFPARTVVDVHAPSFGLHQARLAQLGKMVTDGRLAHADDRGQVAIAHLAGIGAEQQGHQLHPYRVG